MCGIFGWLNPGFPVDRRRAADAVHLLRHRGPDDEGYLLCRLGDGVVGERGGAESRAHAELPDLVKTDGFAADAVFGFRRLAIQELSAAGHQPMSACGGKLWIVFNGEVYNFVELRAELEASGAVFRGRSDTEVVLRCWEAWGPKALERFNGMWAIAVLDLREAGNPRVILSRDRCGVKPLFYWRGGNNRLVFASEMKAILAVRDEPWHVDRLMAANFLAWGRYPSPRAGDTFLDEIRMLPPGCLATWSTEGFREERWWDLAEAGNGEVCSAGEATERLRFLLDDSVRLRMRADVPVGTCLSGGLDSSAIVGIVNRLQENGAATMGTGSSQHTFSAVYRQDGPFNERRFIDRVLGSVHATPHFTYPDEDRLTQDFDRMVWHQDEPFSTTSIFAQWCVMEEVAASDVVVLLDGQAADELFAGYRPYRPWLRDMIQQGKPAAAFMAARTASRETGDRTVNALLAAGLTAVLPEFLVQWGAKTGYQWTLRKAAKSVLVPDLVDGLVKHVSDRGSPASYPWRRTTESLEDHLRGLVLDFSLPRLLRYEDRNSMAFSIEARVPFTDFRIVEFAFSPAIRGLKIREGWAKWCLRKAVDDLLPDDIAWRRDKMGFGTPEADLVRGLVLRRSLSVEGVASGFIDAEQFCRSRQRVIDGTAGKGEVLRVFRSLVFISWCRQFNVC